MDFYVIWHWFLLLGGTLEVRCWIRACALVTEGGLSEGLESDSVGSVPLLYFCGNTSAFPLKIMFTCLSDR